MKYIICGFCLFIYFSSASQTNFLQQIGDTRNFYPNIVCENSTSIFYLRNYTQRIPIPASFQGSKIYYIEKANKNTYSIEKKSFVQGDTLQADSIISAGQIYTILEGSRIHIVYLKLIAIDTPFGTKIMSRICYQQFDTALNLIVPEKSLYFYDGIGAYFYGLIPAVKLINNKILVISSAYNSSQLHLSTYFQLDSLGQLLKTDTLPNKPTSFPNFIDHFAVDATQLHGGRVMFSGKGLHAGSSLFDYIETDSNFNLLDTFARKPLQINRPGIINGYFASPIAIFELPSGNWIGAREMEFKPFSSSPTIKYSTLIKLPKASRHTMDSVLIFNGVNASDDYHGGVQQCLSYNKYDRRIYYASYTHATDLGVKCLSNSNYLQIISADTNLQNTWRKFIYSGDNTCAVVSYSVASNNQSGVVISGHRFLASSTAGNAINDEGFIYRIDSATTTGINEPNAPITIRDRFAVYPNPTTDIIVIDDFLGKLADVDVCNMIGQSVYRQQLSGNKQQISLREFASGLYAIRIRTTDKQYFVQKILKK